MTNSRRRELDRAVRAYRRQHPGITLDQARKAVTDRAGRQQGLPARIPAVPLPRPAERLGAYVRRVAAAAGVQRHRAMELLGLEPGTSATERLDGLGGGLPDDIVRALTAATGMTADQARALTAPRPARPKMEAVRHMTEANFAAGHYRRGGSGKTSTSGELAAALALTLARRAHMIDISSPAPAFPEAEESRTLPFGLAVNEPSSALYSQVIVDLDWPFGAARPPIDPAVYDEVAKTLGIRQDRQAYE